MEELRSKRKVVTDAEIMRRETLSQVGGIDKALRKMKGVREFEEELFKTLIEKVNVLNKVQVEFVLRAGVGVIEII